VRQTINPAMALKDGKPVDRFARRAPIRSRDAAAVLPQSRFGMKRAGGARAADGDHQQLPRSYYPAHVKGKLLTPAMLPKAVQEALATKGPQLDIRNVKGVGSVKAILIDRAPAS